MPATAQADIENVTAALQQQQAVIAQARATVAVDQANLTYAEQESNLRGCRSGRRRQCRQSSEPLALDTFALLQV
jgi:Spy/CpxP family protein refolding chaperone